MLNSNQLKWNLPFVTQDQQLPSFLAILTFTNISIKIHTLTSLIKGHACLFFSRKKSSLPSDFHVIDSTLPASTAGRVDFPSYPFIIACPFIREVRVS